MNLERVIEKGIENTEAERGNKADSLRCLICDTPVPGAVCGRKEPCPSCGFPYPLGDCSDLAEN